MWILHICHSYYPPFLDCARQYNALFKGSKYKILTVYLTGESDADVERETHANEVVFLGYKSKQVRGLKLAAIKDIKGIVSKRNFKLCIAHRAKPTYVALWATKLPVISVRHNYDDFKRISRRVVVNLFRKRLLLLGVSDAVRDDIHSCLPSWPQEKVQTLYNRIDVQVVQSELVSMADARQALKLPNDAWIVGNVGRLHHDKDQATLIKGFAKALPQLPSNSLLIIIGSGPLESDLKQLVANLHIERHVVFAGQIKNARQYFKAFDVFALTSDREPFGMVLLEAMTAELPLICSDCGGGREVVEGVGQLFSFGDVSILADCLLISYENRANVSSVDLKKKLNDLFTDDAARRHFWQLAPVQRMLGLL